MSTYQYQITSNGEGQSMLSLIADGKPYVATSDHPNWEMIVRVLTTGGDPLPLFNTSLAAVDKFNKVSERVSLRGNQLFFDNDPIDGVLADQIVRFMREGQDFGPLVKFYEKLAGNPMEHSRDQLYAWLEKYNFTIDVDGDIVMYKGVAVVDETEGWYKSIHGGPAIVDGVAVHGQVPQKIGSVVEMPRSKVQHDPAVGCSSGLHAATWDYAKSFAHGRVLTVKVDPRDVVSVPTECDWAKVRVCRYTVTGVTEVELNTALWGSYDVTYNGFSYSELADDMDAYTAEENDVDDGAECSNCLYMFEEGDTIHTGDLCDGCYSDILAELEAAEAEQADEDALECADSAPDDEGFESIPNFATGTVDNLNSDGNSDGNSEDDDDEYEDDIDSDDDFGFVDDEDFEGYGGHI